MVVNTTIIFIRNKALSKMMIEETLQSIGLAKNEIRIYLALLELGPSLIGKICGRTKIHRRNVYDSIEMLKDKGFVSSTIINNRNVFEAVSPARILDILDEKKSDIQEIIPQLLMKQGNKQSTARVYTGLNSRKIVFEDKLNYREEQYVLGAHRPSKQSSLYNQNYNRRRIKRKIPIKMLFSSEDIESAREFNKLKHTKVRLLPEKYISPITINIYGSKTAILMASGTLEPISIIIDDKSLSDDFRVYFKHLWNKSIAIKP